MATESKTTRKVLQKLLNSSLVKNVYPMIENIDIVDLDLDEGTMSLDMKLNLPDINFNTMYDYGFDPHYLVDYHIKNLLPYVSAQIPYISFDVYDSNNNYVFGYEYNKDGKKNATYFRPDKNGKKTIF